MDRSTRRMNPASLGVAMGVNAVLVAALLYAGPTFVPTPPRDPLVAGTIDLAPPPPPEPLPTPESKRVVVDPVPAPQPKLDATVAPIPVPTDFAVAAGPPAPVDPGPVTGTGSATVPVDPPAPAPVLIQPGIDPRHAAEFQPVYPADERRAGREGRVVARVLVGADGRVKRIERVSATSDAFWQVTQDRALKRWRFTPGTRDGVATEAWRTMTLTFRLDDL